LNNYYPLDKDRLYFTQFNGDFPVRCPICIDIKKIIRHCKVFRNMHAAWCHVRRDHKNEPKPDVDRIIEIFNSLFDSIMQGIIPGTTTSSSSQNRSHFRRDMHEKLGKIANLLKIQSELFPNFKIKQLMGIIKAVLGKVDDRTRKKYLEIMISMSEKDIVHGRIDVTQFCNTFGV